MGVGLNFSLFKTKSYMHTGFSFEVAENQEIIKKMVSDFAEKNIRQNVMEWDEAQHFPIDVGAGILVAYCSILLSWVIHINYFNK